MSNDVFRKSLDILHLKTKQKKLIMKNVFLKIHSIFFEFSPQSEAIDVDIDEILDMDTDDSRISHLRVSPHLLI